MKTKHINTLITPSEKKALLVKSKDLNVSIAEIFNIQINKYIEDSVRLTSINTEKRNTTLQFRVDIDVFNQFRKACFHNNESVPELVRRFVTKALKLEGI